jgi:hypothetical protein
MTGVEVRGGDAVVVKRAEGGDAAARLRREGERLAQASHPGVVSLVRSAPCGDGWELVVAHRGRPLAGLEPLAPGQVAAIVAGVAATLADLHEIGVVHGRLDASHVLVGDHGRAVLCGFGAGGGSARAEDDVAGVGRLVTELLGADEQLEPIPDRRWRARRWNGWERRALLLLADQATADEPRRRPTARRLAAAITEAIPAADVGLAVLDDPAQSEAIEPVGSESDAAGGPRARRTPALALAVAGAVFAALAVARLRGPDSTAVAPRDAEVPSTDVEVAATVPGNIMVADGKRYRVGQEGDHLLVGDWRCDGQPTPAAFRPSTHEVFVFDRWTAEEALSVEATATVAGGVSMVGERDGHGCMTLSVETATGSVPVEL